MGKKSLLEKAKGRFILGGKALIQKARDLLKEAEGEEVARRERMLPGHRLRRYLRERGLTRVYTRLFIGGDTSWRRLGNS